SLLQQALRDTPKGDEYNWQRSLLQGASSAWRWEIFGDKNLTLHDVSNTVSRISSAEGESIGRAQGRHEKWKLNVERDTGLSPNSGQLRPAPGSLDELNMLGEKAEERRRRAMENGVSYPLLWAEDAILGLDPTSPSVDDVISWMFPSGMAAEARFNRGAS